jgi:cyclic beta-1,2-glucan synthetase
MSTSPAPLPLTSTPWWLGSDAAGVVLTPSGTGFSILHDVLLDAWADDPCDDTHGLTLWVRDLEGEAFAASGAPLAGDAPRLVQDAPQGVTIASGRGALSASVLVQVSEDGLLETRTLTLSNAGPSVREVEVTALLEVVLASAAAQEGHPAFSKLFVQTAWDAARAELVATRRPRGAGEVHPALALALEGAPILGHETDRVRLIGRGRSLADPQALTRPLGGTLGNVLDPVLALRARVTVPAAGRTSLVVRRRAAETPAALAAPSPAPRWCVPRPLAAAPAAARALLEATLEPRRGQPAVSRPESFRRGGGSSPALEGNGYGEFVDEGRAYRIVIGREADGALRLPPMPWTNVIGNEHFGVIASEKGSLTTFAGNSRLHRLSPWRNDPVVDPHEEAFYLRDEASGDHWSALPGPAPIAATYDVRHGHGYSSYTHVSGGLEHAVTLFVPRADPVRIALITLVNPGATARTVSLYSYQRLVQGGTPGETRATQVVRADARLRAVLGENPAAGPFAGCAAFAAFAGDAGAFEASIDRRVFLGEPGSLDSPRAVVDGGPLGLGTPGAACAALKTSLTIPAGGRVSLAALFGEAASVPDVEALLARYRTPGAVDAALEQVTAFWREALGATRIETPVPALDLMANGWLGYQTLVCRLWARSAYYQSGGAYGFRDQLQDAASLAYTHPELLRAQILNHASHQFPEGDVLHWWHPPATVGIRTRFADDLVWLPWLTAHYLAVTGDTAILDEVLPFVGGPELEAGEDERYFQATRLERSASVYEHCVLALDRAMTRGAHGLPLFGSGDWNDGMNRVGREGRGESVWMAFFLSRTIAEFLPVVRARGDAAHAARLGAYRQDLVEAVNDAGWDGAWYRRGYYDSGAVLGSAESDECRIDALAQAWAVISGLAPPERREQALDSLEAHLVSTDEKLIRLLTPPFVDTREDPGYIKGYVAGVRENGGQYTHAALWVVRALAEAGRRARAVELLAMLSPVSHAATPEGVATYQVEPYVVAADVYGAAPHVGRGGWTWYTGSAGWMLRVTLESVLGLGVEQGTHLTLSPRIPDDWPGFTLEHRCPSGARYRFRVTNPDGDARAVVNASLDGRALDVRCGLSIPIADDGALHVVDVTLGPP